MLAGFLAFSMGKVNEWLTSYLYTVALKDLGTLTYTMTLVYVDIL